MGLEGEGERGARGRSASADIAVYINSDNRDSMFT